MQDTPNNSPTQTTSTLFLTARMRREEDLATAALSGETATVAREDVAREDRALAGFRAHAIAQPHNGGQTQGANDSPVGGPTARMGRLLTFTVSVAAACMLVLAGRSFLFPLDTAPVEVAGNSVVETFDRPEIATLGGEDLKCVGPVGVVERYANFQWTGTLAPGESYDLLVFDLSNPQADAAVMIEDLLEARATLDAAETLLLTGPIRWEVRVRGANGRLTERSVAGEASLDS